MISNLITPSNGAIFPWLSSIARNYEMFKFRRLKFEYVTRAPATIFGSVTYAVDFDPTDEPQPSLEYIAQMSGARSSNIWMDFSLPVTGKDLHPQERMYVANEPGVPNRKTDLGRLIEFIDKASSTMTVGHLWVSYEIELIKPQPLDLLSGLKVTVSSDADSGWIIPDDEYYSAGDLSIYSTPGFQDTVVMKQNFEGLLMVWIRAVNNVGLSLHRYPKLAVQGQFRALRCLTSYDDSRTAGFAAGDHGLYMILVKTGPVGRENRITFTLTESPETGGNRVIDHVRSAFIPGDIRVLDRVIPRNNSVTAYDYVPWTIPALPANLPKVPLPVSSDFPQ
jgi:hypothetical protein